MQSTTQLPTDPDELAAVLQDTQSTAWPALYQQLLAQLDGDEATAEPLFETAEGTAMRNWNIKQERAALCESLRQLGAHGSYAVGHLSELVSLFDVEYAEGQAGRDLAELITKIQRNIRLAVAVNELILRVNTPKATS